MISALVEQLPLWAVFLCSILLASVFVELGYQTGLYRRKSPNADDETRINAMTGAHLGLLAFVLAFTFNLAAGHHTERRHLLLEEVNAIETAYLRADLVDQHIGQSVQEKLRRYVHLRASFDQHSHDLLPVIEKTEAVQSSIWEDIDALADLPGFSAKESLLVNAVNEVFDLHGSRKFAALYERIPSSIWTMLFSILALSMFGLGYFSGMKGRRSAVTRGTLTLSLSMMIFLIADLDRPISGLVRGDQSLMIEYHQQLLQRP
jgi:hypothetical protein